MDLLGRCLLLALALNCKTALATEEIDILSLEFGDNNIYATNLSFPLTGSITTNQLTFCARFYFEDLKLKQFFSIGRNDTRNNEVSLKLYFLPEGIGLFENEQFHAQFRHPRIYPLQWYHLCLAINQTEVMIMLDGQFLDMNISGHGNNPITEFKLELNEKVYRIGSKGNRPIVYQGMLTEIYLWKIALNSDELFDITSKFKDAKLMKKDLLFAWNKIVENYQNFKMNMVTLSKKSRNEICYKRPKSFLFNPNNVANFDEASKHCETFGGKLYSPSFQKEFVELEKFLMTVNAKTPLALAWLGLKKKFDSGGNEVVVKYNTNEPIDFLNWADDQPNGGQKQMCMTVSLPPNTDTAIYDMDCEERLNYVCELQENVEFHAKNITKNGSKDVTFYSKFNNGLLFVNQNGKKIILENGLWFWKDLDINTTFDSLTSWNDNMKFTKCLENSFTCKKYGTCLDIKYRCDNKVDCPNDESDEMDCESFIPHSGYDKRHPPKTTNFSIDVSLDILDIYHIEELQYQYKIRFRLIMKWFDPRITFNHLHEHSPNNLLEDEFQHLWMPELSFGKSVNGDKTIIDGDLGVKIERTVGDPDNDKEVLTYDGKSNAIITSRSYNLEHQCRFNLRNFPFDKQFCYFEIAIPERLKDQYKLNLEKVEEKPIELIQYNKLESLWSQNKNIEKIDVILRFEREFVGQLFITYLPTLSLIAVTELTLIIDPGRFEATIMVALTSKLVMYTLYQSVEASLPQTAYLKLIDIWLLMGLLLPFVIMLILIAVDKGLMNGKAIKTIKIAIPLVTLHLILIYIFNALFCVFDKRVPN